MTNFTQTTAMQTSSPRASMPRVATCPSWRSRLCIDAVLVPQTTPFAGFGFVGTGNDLGTTVGTTSTIGANHRTHKPYHQRPKEKHL